MRGTKGRCIEEVLEGLQAVGEGLEGTVEGEELLESLTDILLSYSEHPRHQEVIEGGRVREEEEVNLAEWEEGKDD